MATWRRCSLRVPTAWKPSGGSTAIIRNAIRWHGKANFDFAQQEIAGTVGLSQGKTRRSKTTRRR